MCGIYACVSRKAFSTASDIEDLLCNRGPDHIGRKEVKVHADGGDGEPYYVSFTSTVLALRGGQVIAQPFKDTSSGTVFCWNGEAWKVNTEPVAGNDGHVIFNLLLEAIHSKISGSDSVVAVLKVLRSISGPFAFTFLDKMHGILYFGRDRLGRRSLLYNKTLDSIQFASISGSLDGDWREVEADGIYQLTFTAEQIPSEVSSTHLVMPLFSMRRHDWEDLSLASPASLGIFNKALPSRTYQLNTHASSVERLKQHLCESLSLRILNVPDPPNLGQYCNVHIAILFSGGLDCTVLARMAHDILPIEQEIDLINVAFENPRVIEAARKPPKVKKQAQDGPEYFHQKNAEKLPVPMDGDSFFELCPDRETGRKAFHELQKVCTSRLWRFIAVNVPYSETLAHRAKVIRLIKPHNTEMDLSIAYALYFASRGAGIASNSLDKSIVSYSTPARVLLSGLGADELFGGYTRHATAFSRNGLSALLDELELDVNRLGKRNLGRDDRVISHWGKEVRFPYLDESLVKWAVECPIWEKCGFSNDYAEETESPNIEPGKKILRLLAYNLDMQCVAQEKKRAIQFGARTAKMDFGKTKGTTLIS